MTSNHASTPASRFLYLVVICLVAALGGLLFGFDTAVISGTVGFFEKEFGLTPAGTDWVASSALVGCFFGALIAGAISDRFGRKKVLLLSAVFFTVSAVWCGLARTATELVLARLVGGLGIGIASLISPLYIAEISPPRIRGMLVALQQLAIVLGILGAFWTNSQVLKTELADAAKWRWMFAIGAFPAVVFLVLILPVPESPRWLTKQGFADKARAILARVVGEQEAQAEMAQILDAIAQGGQTPIYKALFSFSGRIGRGVFWEVWLLMFSINGIVGTFIVVLAAEKETLSLLSLLWLPVAVWVGLAMQAKRWHDRDKSAWMILINLIPIIGGIWSLVELGFLRGTLGRNRYGEAPKEEGTLADLFKRGARRALFVGITLMVLTQVTGINAIMYYAPEVFKQAGAGATAAFNDTVWVGLTNLVFTLLSMAVVDRLGRKPLLLIGATCMGVALAFVGWAFYAKLSGLGVLLGVLGYVASFAFSMGVVGWVLVSEIYPTRTRGRAMSLATGAVWAACFAVSQTFPIFKEISIAGTFWGYGALCVVAVVFVWFCVPETKGRTLEEIEKSW